MAATWLFFAAMQHESTPHSRFSSINGLANSGESGSNHALPFVVQEMVFRAGQLLLEDPEGNANSKCGRQLNVSRL